MMLINTTQELREYLPASVALSFNDIRPKIKLVEREVIRRIFSKSIYDAVTAADASEELLELKDILGEAVAHLALLNYMAFGQVIVDSGGVRISVNENLKTAFEWQIDDLRDECTRQGWSAVEAALEFLENSTSEDILTIWHATPTYLATQKALISTMREFEKFVNINHSRVLFNKLLPVLHDMQEEVIIPAMGLSLYSKMNEASPQYKQVRKLAAKALAFQTMAVGFLDNMLILSDNGPLVIDGMVSRQPKAKRTAPVELVKMIADNYKQRAAGAKTELLEYCQANALAIPEYLESPNYISDQEQTDHIPRNDPEWGGIFL